MFSQFQRDEPNLYGNSSNQSGNQGGMGSQTGMGNLFSGLGDIFSSIMGGQGSAYQDAQKQYQKYIDQAQQYQNPFYYGGQMGLSNANQWLNKMKNPTQFINNTMDQYESSPYAQYLQREAMNAGNNAASASGLLGSTPMAQQMQQNAANISSQDMNQWLQNVLGINTQYGAGQMGLAGMGQNSANQLTNLYGNAGENMAQLAYNKKQAEQNRWPQAFSGLSKIFGGGNGGGSDIMKSLPFLMG